MNNITVYFGKKEIIYFDNDSINLKLIYKFWCKKRCTLFEFKPNTITSLRRLTSVRPDLAKFCHFGKMLEVFSHFWGFICQVFDKMLHMFWSFFMPLGKFSMLKMAKYWKHNLVTLDVYLLLHPLIHSTLFITFS